MRRIATGREAGFGILDLLLALGLAALLAALAMPGFGQLAAAARVRTEINALHHALHQARSESIKRMAYVVLCPSRDLQRCDPGAGWSDGWLLYVESTRTTPPQRDAGERLLRAHRVAPAVTIAANRRYFAVRTRQYRATNGTFLACDRSKRVAGRALIVSPTGRPRTRPERDIRGRLVC